MIPGLESAVAAGVIDRATADRLLPYLQGSAPATETSDPDDEKLRLVTGFNDIFVTIGLVMFLGALGYLVSSTEHRGARAGRCGGGLGARGVLHPRAGAWRCRASCCW